MTWVMTSGQPCFIETLTGKKAILYMLYRISCLYSYKNALPFAQETRLSMRAFFICRMVCHRTANAIFLMRRISLGSIFVKPKHFLPKSFSDAPMR